MLPPVPPPPLSGRAASEAVLFDIATAIPSSFGLYLGFGLSSYIVVTRDKRCVVKWASSGLVAHSAFYDW